MKRGGGFGCRGSQGSSASDERFDGRKIGKHMVAFARMRLGMWREMYFAVSAVLFSCVGEKEDSGVFG